MFAWVVRIVLLAAGALTGLFVAQDAPNFSVIQGMVAVALIVLFVFVLVFWPARWSRFLNRDGPG